MWRLASSPFSRRFGFIALYHGVFQEVPEDLRGNFHNVSPDSFVAQIHWIENHFEILSLDDFMSARSVAGKAAITFDDAYTCVFEVAAPILLKRNIPFTVFVNGNSLSGEAFWRDKVRYLSSRNLIDDFIAFREGLEGTQGRIEASGFYRQSKRPDVHSRRFDQEMDSFAERIGISQEFQALSRHIAAPSDLIADDRVTYGNHSYSHYVMSSLEPSEQKEEIDRNREFLSALGLPLSKVFAVPFGGARDFGTTTIELLKAAGYAGALYSRNLLNRASRPNAFLAERFMPSDDMSLFHKRLFRACYKTLRPRDA